MWRPSLGPRSWRPGLTGLRLQKGHCSVPAQKNKKGKILDLLPDFKETTGLDFVMHAEDKHRKALYDLIQNAGLEVV